MTSRVEWTRQAKNELAELWLYAVDRKSVTNSAREIENALKYDGANAGKSRVGSFRILLGSVINCYNVYREFDRTAIIVKVWRHQAKSN